MAILKKYIILPLLALNVTGCYTEFEPDIDDSPVLCLNSLISAGEPVAVSVTHTWRYSSGYRGIQRDVTVKDADVALYVNGSNVDDLVYSEEDRKFHSDYVPLSGDTVRIVAFNQTYGSAEASVVV
ncbi:MAG: DUF4249 domain-containing protein, partial [Muribaculaceae bacterium]|nr:DUF4249 domain-containing protein [Muribaculaceae bacterium]